MTPSRALRAAFAAAAILLLLAASVPAPVAAFKPKTHMQLANLVIEELDAANRTRGAFLIDIDGRPYLVNQTLGDALVKWRRHFRGGAVGPDAFPDIMTGQGIIHPDNRCANGARPEVECTAEGQGASFAYEWLDALLERGLAYAPSDAREAGRSEGQVDVFSYGFLTHAAGDMWAHTLVNEFAGEEFPALGDALVAGEKRNVALRHMVVEAYIGKHTPDYGAISISAPADRAGFLYDFFIADKWGAAQRLGLGAFYRHYRDLDEKLEAEARSIRATMADCAADGETGGEWCIVGWQDRYSDRLADIAQQREYIQRGLEKWPIFSLDVAQVMFSEENPDEVSNDTIALLVNWTIGSEEAGEHPALHHPSIGYRPGLLRMEGRFATADAMNFADDALDALGWLGDIIADITGVGFVQEAVSEATRETLKDARNALILVTFGVDIEVFSEIEQHPGKYLRGEPLHIGPGDWQGTRLFPEDGSAKAALDRILGIAAGSNAAFDPTRFGPANDTVVLTKLLLLDPCTLNAFLYAHRVGPIYPSGGPCTFEIDWEDPCQATAGVGSGTTSGGGPPGPGSGQGPVGAGAGSPSTAPSQAGASGGGGETSSSGPGSAATTGTTPDEEWADCSKPPDRESFDPWLAGLIADEGVRLGSSLAVRLPNVWITLDKRAYAPGDALGLTIETSPKVARGVVTAGLWDESGMVLASGEFRTDSSGRAEAGFEIPATATPGVKVFATYGFAHAWIQVPLTTEDPTWGHPNAMGGFLRSLDGHEGWRHAATLPGPSQGKRFGEGMPLWTDCLARARVFRDVFKDWREGGARPFSDSGERPVIGVSDTPGPKTLVTATGGEIHAEGDGLVVDPGVAVDIVVDMTERPYWQDGEYRIEYQLRYSGMSDFGATERSTGPVHLSPYEFSGVTALRYRGVGTCPTDGGDLDVPEHWHELAFLGDPGSPAWPGRAKLLEDLRERSGVLNALAADRVARLLEVVAWQSLLPGGGRGGIPPSARATAIFGALSENLAERGSLLPPVGNPDGLTASEVADLRASYATFVLGLAAVATASGLAEVGAGPGSPAHAAFTEAQAMSIRDPAAVLKAYERAYTLASERGGGARMGNLLPAFAAGAPLLGVAREGGVVRFLVAGVGVGPDAGAYLAGTAPEGTKVVRLDATIPLFEVLVPTTGFAPGDHDLEVTVTDGTRHVTRPLLLRVHAAEPTEPALVVPSRGSALAAQYLALAQEHYNPAVGTGLIPAGLAALLSDRMVARVTLASGETVVVKLEFDASRRLVGASEISEFTVKRFQPGAEIRVHERTLRGLAAAKDPTAALMRALDTKDVEVKGLDAGSKVTLGVATAVGRVSSKLSKGELDVKPGATRSITFEGRPATLSKSPLGYRIVAAPATGGTIPDKSPAEASGTQTFIVVDANGARVGHTTAGMQTLVGKDPSIPAFKHSFNAGIVGKIPDARAPSGKAVR